MQVRRRTARELARRGFTLMEILVVVAIIVMLAGISSYYVLERYEDAKLSTAKMKISQLTQYCKTYRLNNGDIYPPSLDVLTQMQPNGGSPLALPQELLDPWNKPFQYDPSGANNMSMQPDIFTVSPKGQTIGNWPTGVN
jgi:general secretion pathway protein G